MLSKPKIYLETTIPNAVFNDHTPQHQNHAKQLVKNIKQGRFEAYISDIVIRELSKAPKNRKNKALNLIKNFLILKEVALVRNLANAYIKAKVVSAKHRNDALHIAIATYYKMDIIVSYNLDHIVRFSTKDKVEKINLDLKYLTPKIIMPEELL